MESTDRNLIDNFQQTHDGGLTVHVIGAGPVGLFITALLQSTDKVSIRLYEKRSEYTRTRMVRLASYLIADSIESYRADYIDSQNVEAVFDPQELSDSLAFRQSIPEDLMTLLREWTQGFCPLNTIEQSLSKLIEARGSNLVQRTVGEVTTEGIMDQLQPGNILIDSTGSNSLLRDHLVPHSGEMEEGANTAKVRLEYAIVVTFLYGQPYDCNEYCKYFKNIENSHYKFIPMVHRTHYDGRVSHVTGIVNIRAEDYEKMPSRFNGDWLRSNFPIVAQSMYRFIGKIKEETPGQILGDLEIVRIPMDLYHARNATSRQWCEAGIGDSVFTRSSVFLVGDSAIGSPYFQSISLGFECAMYLAGLLTQRDLPMTDIFNRYELYIFKQWMRVYMRSKMIKHNKDLFECIEDKFALLDKLHIY